MRQVKPVACAVLVLTLIACGESPSEQPELSFEESLQQRLIEAGPGAVIEIPPGRHELRRGLSLNVDSVTLRGAGMEVSLQSDAD